MNNKTRFLFLLLFAFSLANAQEKYPQGIEHVIIIGVDGLSPDGIRTANTPIMHSLIKQGTVKWNVRTVLPSSSSPNWASMIMGAGPELHGITDNDWEKDQNTLPAISRNSEGLFPTIFGVIKQARPNAEIGAVYHWDGFGRLFEKKAVNYDKTFSTEDSTAIAFAQYIVSKKPTFAFMQLDHVDHAGHAYGHGTTAYYKAVEKADTLIGEILTSIKQAGIEKSTLLIITADHGGVGYGHGGATIGEAEITMILSGKDVKKGYEIKQQMVTYDLAATIAFAFHIVPPYVWTGRPAKPAFEGFAEPANLWLGKQLIPAPTVLPAKVLYQQAGGLYVNTPAVVTIKPVAQNAATYYTLDGKEPDTTSTVYKQPFTLNTSTVVKAKAIDKARNESLASTAYFRMADSTKGNGLHVQFYKGNSDWKYLPLFKALTPVAEWNSYEVAVNRDQILKLMNGEDAIFGMVFTGYLQIDTEGEYNFYNSSDDGSKLYIDDKEVVNNDGNHGVVERSGSIKLTPGKHAIKVEFYNGEGGFWIDAFYKGPGMVKQLIPADKLFLNK